MEMEAVCLNGPRRLVTARKRSLRRLCFHRCLFVCPGGGADPPPPLDTMGYGQPAASTHPTGMYSCLHIPPTSVFMNGIFDLFTIMCKLLHRAALDPFLKCMKNGDIDGTYGV